MKFLIDNALSPSIAVHLSQDGHDAIHVQDIGFDSAPDQIIFDRAKAEDRVLVSADTDFGTLLAASNFAKPSVILFRRGVERVPSRQIALLKANLPGISDLLEQGCLVIIEDNRLRTRRLPFGSQN